MISHKRFLFPLFSASDFLSVCLIVSARVSCKHLLQLAVACRTGAAPRPGATIDYCRSSAYLTMSFPHESRPNVSCLPRVPD